MILALFSKILLQSAASLERSERANERFEEFGVVKSVIFILLLCLECWSKNGDSIDISLGFHGSLSHIISSYIFLRGLKFFITDEIEFLIFFFLAV